MSVTVIGDAFIDILVPTQGIKLGGAYHRNVVMQCGGTANVAALISELGEKAKFVGKVGNDALGHHFKENLQYKAVKDFTFISDQHPTGICVVLIDERGERTMVTSRGANDLLTKEDIDRCIDEILNSRIVYLSGYLLQSPISSESVIYAMEKSKENGCEIWFNPGAPNIITSKFKKIIKDFVDVLILNIEEAKKITKEREIDKILSSLKDVANLSVITMGKDGCFVSNIDGYIHVEANRLKEVIDATGAGDAFSAGFIVGRLRGMNEKKCAELGHKTAAKFLSEKNKFFTK